MTNSLSISSALKYIGDNDLKSKIPKTSYYAANALDSIALRSLMNVLVVAGIVTAAGYSGNKFNLNVPPFSLGTIGVIGGMSILTFEASHYLDKFFIENDDGSIKETYKSLAKRISRRLASAALLASALAVAAYAVKNMQQMNRVSQYIPSALDFSCRQLLVATAAGVASAAALIWSSAFLEDKLSETIVGIVGPDLKKPKTGSEESGQNPQTPPATGDVGQGSGSNAPEGGNVPQQAAGSDATPQVDVNQGAGTSTGDTSGQGQSDDKKKG